MHNLLKAPAPAQPETGAPVHTNLLLALLLLIAAGCQTQGSRPRSVATQPAASTNEKPAATYTMARSGAKPKPQVDAVFEAVEMAPVKLETKSWTDLPVLEAVAHGARVRKGDMLVRIDTEKLTDQIEDLERERPAAALAYELAAADLENAEHSTPLSLDAARRRKRIADEDMAYFEKTGRPAREKSAQFGIKSADQRLDGAKEELKQLEKMYKADDLIEDTEEIILRRQRFALESAEYGLEVAKENSAYNLKTAIPREAEGLKNGKRDQELALALAEQSLPRTLAKKRLDFEKLKRDQKKADKKLSDLQLDLKTLSGVRSPIDGIVYYGACEAGKWTTGSATAKKLLPGAKLSANEVFITVVNPERLFLRATVPESDLGQFTSGMEGKAALVSAPDKKFPVKLEELGAIPLPGGGFEARFSVRTEEISRLMPGMNCKVSLSDGATEALRAPAEAIFEEEREKFVYVLKGDNPPEKRKVRVGARDGKMVEILQGLREGEVIARTRPK
jgi:multidrug efflux pump subunit AcrA (membrane-fusion protein)